MTQHSDTGEAQTRGPSVSSQALYHYATDLPTDGFIRDCQFKCFNPYPANKFLSRKCCLLFTSAAFMYIQMHFSLFLIMETNTRKSDHTVPFGAVWFASILFAI